ncbi:uncharacterized protein LOC105837251 isoform X9 [Monomorium pharaonis]|uniref:uncharacterized protein LOC105837251 isoform X9 n=1 Tax=Monomorium pharaonis TaxID=307658 RepID=UPI001746B37B|nr:uncharacterized protein LOC105837251 isoform X9 [Monomorium pharaonis]
MNNTNENTEDLDVSTSKQTKNTSFQTAFSNLKKSEFFKDLLFSQPETSVAAALSKINTILVNVKQRGNPLLKFITNVSWEYSDIVPDYVMGKTTCALFLSIRYHQLNPDYIHERLKLLNNTYNLRVLLVQLIPIDFPRPRFFVDAFTQTTHQEISTQTDLLEPPAEKKTRLETSSRTDPSKSSTEEENLLEEKYGPILVTLTKPHISYRERRI